MRRSGLAVLASLVLLACGHGSPGGTPCQHNFDCKAGEGCVDNVCQKLPCGGCQPDQACGTNGQCVAAQGAVCTAVTSCPTGYPCNSGGICSKPCTLNSQCDPGLLCNGDTKSCAQCISNSDCASVKGKPVCDTDGTYPAALTAAGQGSCVQCVVDFDCVKALGSGHFCDAHVCKVGCASNNDCNSALNETCDTSTTPGKCVQCHTNNDCAAAYGQSASVCDDTKHCVQCWGSDQTSANTSCGGGTNECNLTTKTCVQCLPANNASGADCGSLVNGSMDPHDARTCDPATNSCTCGPLVPNCTGTYAAGCQTDSQCGCPRNVFPGATEDACVPMYPHQITCSHDSDCGAGNHCVTASTNYCADAAGNAIITSGEHCDPNRNTMPGVTGATLGACVDCTNNTHCEYRITNSTLYPDSSGNHPFAKLNGARCVADNCVEGCDADADCYPNHVSDGSKICHLGLSGDPNNHKCVTCNCDNVSADGTYCDYLANNTTRACANDSQGRLQVCDHDTLQCRRKREGEVCLADNECGAPMPGSDCQTVSTNFPDGFCVKIYPGDSVSGRPDQWCSPGLQTGRCASFCGDGCTCVGAQACGQAEDPQNQQGMVCVPSSCTCTSSNSSCP